MMIISMEKVGNSILLGDILKAFLKKELKKVVNCMTMKGTQSKK